MWGGTVWRCFFIGLISVVYGNSLCPNGDPFIIKKCSEDSACSPVSEQCYQGTCCPKAFNSGPKCPGGNPVEIKSCASDEFCSVTEFCNQGTCCPKSVNQDSKCPGGNPAEIKSCASDESCSVTEFCNKGTCCPKAINQDSKCPGGNPVEIKSCASDESCSVTEFCNKGICCPKAINKDSKCPGGNPSEIKSCASDESCSVAEFCNKGTCCPKAFNKPGSCPTVASGTVGICVEQCSDDSSCGADLKCCSNGCGHTCQKPVKKAGKCPLSLKNLGGVCIGQMDVPSCKTDNDCPTSELCCRSECGIHVCSPPEEKTPCQRELEAASLQVLSQVDSCNPVFIPRCDSKGNYERTQCYDHNGMCFCVFQNGTKIPGTEVRGNPDCSRATKPGVCPHYTSLPAIDLRCMETCQSDDSCQGDQKCCSNGCGYHCMGPVGKNSLTTRKKRDTNPRCTYDPLFVPVTECRTNANTCSQGSICDPVTQWCCPPMSVEKCPVGYQVTSFCNNGQACPPGLQCLQGSCCHVPVNSGSGIVDYTCKADNYRTTTKCEEGNCASGSFQCENGYCCPTRLIKDISEYQCKVDGYKSTTKCCDGEGTCASSTFHCENGYCCPTRLNEGTICVYRRYIATSVTYIGSVASGTMPSVEACKAACDRNTISDCIGVVYQQNTGKCTKYPDTSHLTKVADSESEFFERHCQFSAGLCPDQNNVLMSDGVPKTCNMDTDCDVISFGCINGHCCPKGGLTTVAPVKTCSNGADPSKNVNGLTKTCKVASDCGEPATCENQICCPTPIQEDFCPNKSLPLMENGKPKACMGVLLSECGSSRDYACKGSGDSKYCCPTRINNMELCPNKGMPLLTSVGNAQRCSSTMDCGDSTYSCQSSNIDGYKYCCPSKLLITEMCPNQGYVMVHGGHPKRCSMDFECIGSSGKFSCVNNYCCPKDANQAVCPNNGGLLLDEKQQPKLCTDNIECQGSGKGAYYCNEGYCCSQPGSISVCPNNGMVKMMDNKSMTCVKDADCGEVTWSCEGGHCCPLPINTVCPNGSAPKCCKLDLCVHHSCPANPSAQCRINPCGDCKAEFYDDKNTLVNCFSGLSRCEKMRLKALSLSTFWMDTDVGFTKQYLGQVKSKKQVVLPTAERVISSGKAGECLGLHPKAVKALTQDCTSDEDCQGTSKCCLNKCQVPISVLPHQAACAHRPVTGPCKGRMIRHFYNSTSNRCEQFVYGGCKGNENNFGSQKACERACSKAGLPPQCLPDPDTGRCRARIPMYFYNVTSNKCEKFYYGGCEGNRNRFLTLTQCLSTCSSRDVQAAPCEKIRCAAGTICLPVSDTEAKCISDKVPPVVNGNFVPDCLDDGRFAEMQCQGSLCWCVDDIGVMKPNTMRVGKPPCYKSVTGVTDTSDASRVPVCADGSAPVLCDKNECDTAKCEGRSDVTCVVDPCNKCKVSFVDTNNKPVTCNVDKCALKKPISTSRNKQGCGNLEQRWVFDAQAKECEHFLFSSCDGEDIYYKSQWECRSKCIGAICNGGGPKSCVTSCSDQVCRRFPAAQCQIHPCTCEVMFFDLVSNVPVNCDSVTPLCQLRRSQEKRKALMKEMYNYKVSESVPISVCDVKGEFSPQQCDAASDRCWCVDGLGNKLTGSERKVSGPAQNIGCSHNKTVSAMVSLLFKLDYDVYVKGKEEKLKGVVIDKLKEISPKMIQHIKTIKIRKGSVYVDIEFGQTSENSEPEDIGSLVNVLENEVNNGLDMRFEGQTITAEPETKTTFTFQAQTSGDISKSPTAEKDESATTTIVVVVVICVVVLIAIVAFIVYRKRKGQQEKNFTTLNTSDPESPPMKQSSVYYHNQACDKK
ncbi:LOW QUALITY PROTEIN: zonadhesin-like [Saccostrea cucullata]|uniref:LOW QUALITY PROTEIN: zonadhesin-like n=1 Tax=Saccostrea cuccullata TaxID=36930 RepID=UPI002ED1535D